MSDPILPNPTSDSKPDESTLVELLIGRVIDGEADEADLSRLADLAATDPGVWRLYAARRTDHVLLQGRVASEVEVAQRVALPATGTAGGILAPVIDVIRVSHGYLAWAAVIALALVIGMSDRTPAAPGVRVVDRNAVQPGPVLSSDEFDPVLLHSQPLPDGRVRVTWMRRIIEVLDLDEFDPALDVRRVGEEDVIPPAGSSDR